MTRTSMALLLMLAVLLVLAAAEISDARLAHETLPTDYYPPAE